MLGTAGYMVILGGTAGYILGTAGYMVGGLCDYCVTLVPIGLRFLTALGLRLGLGLGLGTLGLGLGTRA